MVPKLLFNSVIRLKSSLNIAHLPLEDGVGSLVAVDRFRQDNLVLGAVALFHLHAHVQLLVVERLQPRRR